MYTQKKDILLLSQKFNLHSDIIQKILDIFTLSKLTEDFFYITTVKKLIYVKIRLHQKPGTILYEILDTNRNTHYNLSQLQKLQKEMSNQ